MRNCFCRRRRRINDIKGAREIHTVHSYVKSYRLGQNVIDRCEIQIAGYVFRELRIACNIHLEVRSLACFDSMLGNDKVCVFVKDRNGPYCCGCDNDLEKEDQKIRKISVLSLSAASLLLNFFFLVVEFLVLGINYFDTVLIFILILDSRNQGLIFLGFGFSGSQMAGCADRLRNGTDHRCVICICDLCRTVRNRHSRIKLLC